ncbi:MAG TPA: ABC transporter ATP-binding protein [Verrucomicrobiae bacterium]|jgi:ABC-2 type transport system ATP-binding protein|nr:ABC transporter ATP-binding protein [Verrucomicrobiae bacterium]
MQLVLESLGKRYPGRGWALSEFTLTLEPGVTGLLGPNGAGKSTLMRILATVTRPSAGRVLWEGRDLSREPDALRETLGYLPQDFGIYPQLSALEFMDYIAAAKGLEPRAARQRTLELLELVNLGEARNRPLGGFSGGMRQRVGIAQALLNDPRVLIVDEPTAGLDPEERVRFRNLLGELSGDRIVLLSTHIVSDVEATATRIVVMGLGRMIADSSPEGLLEQVRGRVWELETDASELDALRTRHLVGATLRRGPRVLARVVSETAPGAAARPAEPSLEDAYLLLQRAAQPAAA